MAKHRPSLNLQCLRHLAQRVGLPLSTLTAARDHLPASCRHRQIPGNHQPREIYWAPSGSLLHEVHRRLKVMLSAVTLPREIMGGRPRRQLRDFARPHIGKPVVIEIDIQNFYPSISRAMVRQMLAEELACSLEVADLMANLTTIDGAVPHGFQTSTHIANLLLRPVVLRLRGISRQHGASLTVWGDNIVLSGPAHLANLSPLLCSIIEDAGLTVHPPRVMYRHAGPQTICNVTVNNGLAWCRDEWARVHRMLEQLSAGQRPDGYESIEQAVSALCSTPAGIKPMAPRAARRLRQQIDAAGI